MSEPIFRELEATLGHIGLELRDDTTHLRTWLGQHIHPSRAYHALDGAADPFTPKGTTVSALTDGAAGFAGFLDRIKADAENVAGQFLPALHDGAARLDRLTQSKIVQELEALAAPIDPALETLIAGMINAAGAAAAKVAQLTAPAAPADVPQQPVPADGGVQPIQQISGIAQ